MKRCIQCEFVYEDDQGVCDMDGADLTYEPTLHSFGGSGAPVTIGGSTIAKWKGVAALPVAVFMLGAVFFVGNDTSHSTMPQAANQPPTKAADEQPPASDPVIETPGTEPTPSDEESPEIPATSIKAGVSASPIARPSPTRSRSAAPSAERKSKPAKAKETIGGFLKKTSRILKKPFKKL